MLDYIEFPYKPPEGHSYETKHFTSNILSIWLHHPNIYSYTSNRVTTIWGFYNRKTKCYHAPITSIKCGNKVDVSQTTAYSAIIPKYNPLEALLYSGEN
jgi:hypothetical protein